MTMMPRLIVLLGTALAFLLSTSHVQAQGDVDLSTPEAAIMTYCMAPDLETRNAVMCCGIKFDGPHIPYRDCTIEEIGPAHDNGAVTADGPIRKDDIEIVTEINSRHPDKGDVRRQFLYLLRNYAGEWRIVSWTYIPDENYPDTCHTPDDDDPDIE